MRGYALTVHCPRCGTAKPTGGDVAPLVTCVTCQLSFDPRPREAQARTQLPLGLVPVAHSLVRVDAVEESESVLSVRESPWRGIWELVIVGGGMTYFLATFGTLGWHFAAFIIALCLGGLYDSAKHLVNRRFVRVRRDEIEAWFGPLPRRNRARVAGDLTSIEIKRLPTKRHAVVVDGVELVEVAHEELADELVQAIRFHRARLWEGRDEED
jgi:hypothetical protein